MTGSQGQFQDQDDRIVAVAPLSVMPRCAAFFSISTDVQAPVLADAIAAAALGVDQPVRPVVRGFVAPINELSADVGPRTSLHAGGVTLMRFAKLSRPVPPTALKRRLAQQIQMREQQTGRAMDRQQRKMLEGDVLVAMLGEAFVHESYALVLVDHARQMLLVEATAASLQDDITASLRTAMQNTIQIRPVAPDRRVLSTAMTQWLRDDAPPSGYELGEACVLRDSAKATVKFGKHELGTDEVKCQIDGGKTADAVEMIWKGTWRFTLNASGLLTKIALAGDKDETLQNLGYAAGADGLGSEASAAAALLAVTGPSIFAAAAEVFEAAAAIARGDG